MRGRKVTKRIREGTTEGATTSSPDFSSRLVEKQPSATGLHSNSSPSLLATNCAAGPKKQHDINVAPGFVVAPGLGTLLASPDVLRSSSALLHDDAALSSSQAAFPISGQVVRLNVGGELFVVQRDTLLGNRSRSPLDCSEANYFHRLLNPDAGAAASTFVDATGAILVDRDPLAFSIILNYLRGYDNALVIPSFLKATVAQDADYYHLLGLKQQLADPFDDTPLLFQPGPGVAPERRRFKPTYGVNFIGDRFAVRGRHRVTLEVLGADYLGIGVASDACVAQDAEFHRTANCCVYYMSGVFYSTFPSPRKEEALVNFGVGDIVEMHLDMDARILTYTIRDVTKVVSVKSAYRLRFAVTIKKKSSVRIVDYSSEM